MNTLSTLGILAIWAIAIVALIWFFTRGQFVSDDLYETSFIADSFPFDHSSGDGPEAPPAKPIHPFDKYSTVSGEEVVILTTNKPGPFPIAGYMVPSGALLQWDCFGKSHNFDPAFNLVEAHQ